MNRPSRPKCWLPPQWQCCLSLSSVGVAHAARHDGNPWNPNQWRPGAIGGAAGGVVAALIVLGVNRVFSRDVDKAAGKIDGIASNVNNAI